MKLRLFLLFVLIAFINMNAFAQTPTYSNGTAGNSANSFPFQAGSTGSNRVQWIMLNSYFPGAPSGLITDVYFRTNQPSTQQTPTGVVLLMGQSTLTQLTTGNYITPLTTVLNVASVTVSIPASGWMRFTLQTPFFYDNTKNFIIEAIAQNSTVQMMQTSTATGARMYGNYLSTTGTANTGLVDFGFDLLPKKGYNNAATYALANPLPPFCPGSQTLAVKIKNAGYNVINNIKVGWVLDGIQQADVNYSNPIDTIAGTGVNVVTVTLGNVLFAGSPRNIKVYTKLPNGIVDTVTNDDTMLFVLGPSPNAVITPTTPTIFCTAGVINAMLNAPTSANNQYQWKLNGSPIPGAISSTYNATAAGDYTVTIDSNGCTNTSAVMRVDNLAMPMPVVVPEGYPVMCDGDSVTLVANAGVTGATYQWKFQGNDIIGANTSTYVAHNAGNYTIVTSKLVCLATSQGVNIIPKPEPTPAITPSNNVLTTDPTYITYQWYISTTANPTPTAIPNDTLNVCTPQQNGDYTVTVFNGGCYGTSQAYKVTDVQTGINKVYTAEQIKVYPSPATDVLYIDAPAGAKAIITAIDGKSLIEQAVTGKCINISMLASGNYMVKITDQSNILLKTVKFVKAN